MKRLLAIILASLLILSSATAGASAYQAYKDDALTKYDFTDTAVLTTEQYASALLDYADKALAKTTLKDEVVGIKYDFTSINNALDSIYNIREGSTVKFLLPLLGDIKDLNVASIKDARRDEKKNGADIAVIKSVLEFLSVNKGLVAKAVKGGVGNKNGLNLGSILNGILKIDLDVSKIVREALWNMAYPDTDYSASNNVDDMLQVIIQNALAGVKEIPESVRNLVDLNSKKFTYDFIEDLLQTAYNDMAVPLLNDQTMKWLGQEIDKDTTGTLAGLFNRDFRVSAYTVPAGSTLVAELNNIAGGIVNGLLKNYNGWVSGDNSKLTDNVVAVARYILKETGGYFFPDWQKHIATPEEIDAMSKEELIAYIARSVINASVGYMYIPEDVTTVVGVAWEAVKQLMAQFLPERDYSGYPKTVQGILDMLADYVAYNVNPGIDLNAGDLKKALNYGDGLDKMLTTAVKWLAADPQNYTGLLPTTAIDTSDGWKALDDIFFKLLDKSILPAKFANSGSETIIKDIVYSILNGLLVDQDLTCISDLFVKNESGVFATQTLKQSIVRLVTDILNAVLPGTITKTYGSLNEIVSNSVLSLIVENLLGSLNSNKKELVPPIVNIVAQVMKLTDKAKFKEMEIAGSKRINNSSELDLTVYNGSQGINRGYTDKNNTFTQDKLPRYIIDSWSAVAYNYDGSKQKDLSVSGLTANEELNGGDSRSVKISGIDSNNTLVVFTVSYFVLDEAGNKLTNDASVCRFYSYRLDGADVDNNTGGISTGSNKTDASVDRCPPKLLLFNQNNTNPLKTITAQTIRFKVPKGKTTEHTITNVAANLGSLSGNLKSASSSGTVKGTGGIIGASAGYESLDLWEETASIAKFEVGFDTTINWAATAKKGNKTDNYNGATRIICYNDYGLAELYNTEAGKNRARTDYDSSADAAWDAYMTALNNAAIYTLLPGTIALYTNSEFLAGFEARQKALASAVETLETHLVSASVASLKTAVEAVQGKENAANAVYWDDGYNYFGYDDFNSVTWNGWKEARNRALNLYNSTIAPVEPVAPEKPGDDATLIEKQKYEKAYAQWQTDHAAWETAIAAWQMPTISAIDVAYAEQQVALWGPRLIKLNAVKTHLDAAIAMCTINPADASKYDADRWEAYAKSFAYAQKVSTSFNASTTMRTQVREAMNNLIYNWKRLIANPVVTVTFTFTVNGVTHAVLTGNQGDPVDLSTIAAPDAPVGMHFVGWGNVPATFDADATFEAQFANNTDTKYTVNVYNMDTTGAYPSAPDSTYQGAGETGSTADITADAAPAEGFSLDSANSVLTGTIAADGSLVLSIYYSRNKYTITYANTDLEPDERYYGAVVNPATPEKAGFKFDGWVEEVPATMPAQSITLTAKWNENPADYDEYNVAVADANAKKAEANYDKKYTADTRAALNTALDEDVSGKKLSEQHIVDAQTAKINAAVAGLKLMTYNAEFYVDNKLYRTVATEVDAQIVAPEAPTKEGYTFTGWNPEVGVMGVEDVRFDAKFSAGTVGYKVETYVMGLDGNYGDAAIEDKSATTGETVSVTPETREGFTVADNSVLSGTVEADGSLVLKVYYSRNQYKLSVDGAESMVYYGAAISVAEPTKAHETFDGWDPALPETMPAHDVTVVSTWIKDDADYTAYNAAKAVAEAKQQEENYDKKYTAETRNALAEAIKTVVPEGLKYDEQETIDAATTAINDAVAGLELMTYNATFYVDGTEYRVVPTKVGEQIAKPGDPSKTGYVFTGWNPEVGVMGVEDVRFDAKFSAGEVSYTVETYVMGLDGEYGAAETKNVPATTGEEVTLTPDAREGFTVAGESVLTGKVAADSSLTLKVYYSRNQYKLTVDGAESDVYFGAALEIADPAPREGYTFTGWSPAVPANMPASDLTLVSQWSENDADYTAYNAAVAAAQAKKAETDYDKTYTAESRAALDAALAEKVSGKKYSEQSVVDAAAKAINDAVASLEVMTYNATFYVDGVKYRVVPTKVGEQIVAPKDPSKEGYTFAGWRPSVGVMGTADATFEAVFAAAGNTAYTVNTYVMGTDGTYGEPTSDTLTGTTGSTATYAPEAREGFTVADESVLSGTIAADGSLVLKVFYSRNQYTLTAEDVAYTFYYGAAVSVADPVKTHYTFAGWEPELPETMPAHDVTVAAKWTEDGADYTAYKAAVAAAQAKKAETDYDKTYTAESRAALAEALANDVSGKKYSEQGVVDAATTAINDAVKALERMTYTATFYVDGAVHATVQAKVGEQIALPEEPAKEGYVFTGWDPAVGVMGTEDVSFNAQFTAGAVSYKVETYEMDVNGAYGAATVKTVLATTGEAVSVTPETREGFTVADNSVLSGTVEADSSLVLKVYYSRNQYKLSVDGVESDVYYGAALNIAAPAAREGFTFTGWNVEVPANMPAENLTLVSQWSENDADYSAYNAAVSAAKAKQGEENYDKTYTAETRAALAEALANDVAGKKYSEQSVVDAATKAINDAVAALKVMTYNAIFTVDGVQYEVVPTKVGEQIVAPKDPAKEGYVFKGWDKEVGKMGVEDITFTAQFEKASGIAYTVEVYTMDVNGNYGAAETKTLYGTTDAEVTADTTAAEGFTFDESAANVVSGKVAADGSLVLKVYFARNQYKLTVDGAESEVYYGAALDIATPAARKGYTFTGWNVDVPANMPASDLTLVSQWSENDADYTAYNAAVAAAQAKKAETDYDKTYTAESRAALDAALAEKVSGKKYSEQSVVDAAAKAINDAVASLEVMTYNATFYVDGVKYRVVPTKVGEQIIAPENPTKEGFVFTGWDKEVGAMGTENVSFNAQFSAGEVSYKVETYVMGLDGQYGAAETKTVPATTDAAVSVDPEAREGFTVAADSVLSGTVAADGSLVLKVYYSRNQYKLTVDGAESMVYYGAELNIAEPTKDHYTFAGWNVEVPATMPASDLTLVSQWIEEGADYTAYDAAVKAAQAKQGEDNYDRKYTAETRDALAEALAKDVSGKKYTQQGEVDAATTAINDAVKALELETYTATFYVNGEVHATVTAKVGEQIAAPADPIVDGYNFTGWDPEVGTMGIENVRFDAILVASGSSIISVTPATPNYGGMHQYAVKVKGEPQKLRIVDAYGTTRTFDRNTSMTSDVNAFGILKIEKTEDGEIWTLNVNLVEGEYTALAKFDKAWEEDGYDFTVKFDTKPSEPVSDGVLDVTYNTPNYGGKQEYFVKVSGKADKIQIAYENGGTTTRARYDLRVSIKSYDAQGNEVDAKSANLAYEIWTVKLNIAEGKHVARAKYGKVWTGDHEFTVVYDVKPAPKGVVDVTYDTPNYGGKQQYSFKVDGKASKIQIAYGKGGTTTFIRIDPRVSIKSYDAQGNEVSANSADLAYEIWTVKLSIPEGKHLAKAKYGKTWTDGFEFDVVITSKPIKVVSVTAVSVSADSVAVTVNGTAKKVRITYASGATRTYDRDDIGVSIASNGDGEIWTINVKLTEGDYTATAKYMANGKQVWDTTDFAFTV